MHLSEIGQRFISCAGLPTGSVIPEAALLVEAESVASVAGEAEISLESLILAQDERWRRA